MWQTIPRVSRDQARPGDLIFWSAPGVGIHHVAIYTGGGQIEATRYSGFSGVREGPVGWAGVAGFGRP
jgi:cell wall-associated NlpC family hydrolase